MTTIQSRWIGRAIIWKIQQLNFAPPCVECKSLFLNQLSALKELICSHTDAENISCLMLGVMFWFIDVCTAYELQATCELYVRIICFLAYPVALINNTVLGWLGQAWSNTAQRRTSGQILRLIISKHSDKWKIKIPLQIPRVPTPSQTCCTCKLWWTWSRPQGISWAGHVHSPHVIGQ